MNIIDTQLDTLRTMIQQSGQTETISDDILLTYLRLAGDKILMRLYPYDDTKHDVPLRYGMLQVEIACYLYNRRGAEGETNHNENGINRAYESADVPESMLKNIIPYGKVIV